jgi:hypothetical protein
VAAIATYFDPRVIFIVFPLIVFQKRLQGESHIWGAVLGQALAIGVVWFTMASATQLKNAKDILMVNNPQENVGPFWYIMLEMFKELLEFMKLMYLLMQALMCAFIAMHVHKTFDMLEMPSSDPKKPAAKVMKEGDDVICSGVQVERSKLFFNGVLLVTLVK